MSDTQIISPEGYKKLKEELDYLINAKRKEIADRIEKAKELGDLSENAEYHEAKDAQAFNEGRILEISSLLKNVQVVENNNSKNKVSMGSTVTITDGNKEKTYAIVSFNEADPGEGKISNESPIGMALLDKKKGDKVVITTPKEKKEYTIKDIN